MKTWLIFAFFSFPFHFSDIKMVLSADAHNMFGLLCLKQVISFYIPQPLQLKDNTKHLSTFISPSFPWSLLFLFCLIMSWRQAQRALLKCIFFNSFVTASSLVGEQQEITSGPARRRYETRR